MLRVVTLNIHKGLSQFNRRMVIHELREGLRALEPGPGVPAGSAGAEPAPRAALRRLARARRSTSSSPARSCSTSTGATACTSTGTTATRCCRASRSCRPRTRTSRTTASSAAACCTRVVKVPAGSATCIASACTCRCTSAAAAASWTRSRSAWRSSPDKRCRSSSPGDFNDWRQRASRILEQRLGMTEVSVASGGRHQRPSRACCRCCGWTASTCAASRCWRSQVHRGAPWSLLSDHLAVSAELGRERRERD